MKKAVLWAALFMSGSVLITQPLRAEEKKMDEKITTLKIIDNKIGEGKEAKANSTVSVDYTGWIV